MKNPVVQFSIVVLAFVALAFVMGYTKPADEQPKEYMVVHAVNDKEFQKEVNEKLSEGWRLQGGVATQQWAQAMVK